MRRRTGRAAAARGISLIEAMVAMAIMAFGMLGLVGLQTSMRANADISKQRSEAVRIAQEQMEQWRGYASITEYSAIGDRAASNAASATTNASYTWEAEVSPDLPVDAPLKDVQITVRWIDRASEAQSVTLTTRVVGQSAVINAATGLPADGNRARLPKGRNPAIPLQATDMGNGTSRFVPPGGGNVGWVFNNITGVITSQCDALFTTPSCQPVNLLLLAGYINFDLTTVPNPELPNGPLPAWLSTIEVTMVGVSPGPTQTVACAVGAPAGSLVAYYCAIPPSFETVPSWSGRVWFAASAPLAAASSSASAAEFRFCRYTVIENDTPASVPNSKHPLVYLRASEPLANQNYLVVRGDAYTGPDTTRRCPADNTATPYVNGNTWDQQPARTDPAP